MRSVNLRLVKTIALLGIVGFGSILGYSLKYSNKIYPNILIANNDVSNKTIEGAGDSLLKSVKIPEKIKLVGQSQTLEISTKDIELSYDFASSAQRAFNYTRTGNPVYDWVNRVNLLETPSNLGLAFSLNEGKLAKIISVAAGQNSAEATEPSIKFVNGKIQVYKGNPGIEVDQKLLRAKIGEELSFAKNDDIQIPINKIDNSLTDMGAVLVKSRAEKYLGKKLTLKFEYSEFNYTVNEMVNFINPRGDFYQNKIVEETERIAKTVNRDPQNPKFSFDNGKVSEFLPALDGIIVDNKQLEDNILATLKEVENTDKKSFLLEIPVIRRSPEVTTDKVNNLGIKELIGRGTSTYFHSIPGRVHNVVLAASRINGTLVKPGDTFSFNDTLGDVSQFTGYQQAYIISGGKTILGDGGGVCQVSSTLFRALLNAGLPITERAAHAYRVGYYEQNSPPGMDATVYGPSPDLKFVNDTGNYVLIEAMADPKHYSLAFELYGTNDGRKSIITKPIVTNITPALPTVYQDDPTLPIGTLKQVDFSASGAKVMFSYKVEKDGSVIFSKTFTSNYRPWAAVYLKGTKTTN